MPPLAYFGIESSGLSLVVDLLILFAVVLYCSLLYWTYTDARRRIVDPVMVWLSFAVSLLFPFVGPVVYMVLRPPEFLEDAHERELEIQAAEARLDALDALLCPHCDYRLEPEFVRCPSCLRKLKERCVNCSRPLEPAWTICPYCEAEVQSLGAPRARHRRRDDAPAFEHSSAPVQEPAEPEAAFASEAALGSGEGSLSAGDRRAGDRRAAAAAREAARAGRPRPAP